MNNPHPKKLKDVVKGVITLPEVSLKYMVGQVIIVNSIQWTTNDYGDIVLLECVIHATKERATIRAWQKSVLDVLQSLDPTDYPLICQVKKIGNIIYIE